MTKKKAQPKPKDAEKFFVVEIENGNINEFDTLDEVKGYLEDHSDFIEAVQDGHGWDGQWIVIHGKKLSFDASFEKLTLKFAWPLPEKP